MNEFALSYIAMTTVERKMEKELGPVEETAWRLPKKVRNNK